MGSWGGGGGGGGVRCRVNSREREIEGGEWDGRKGEKKKKVVFVGWIVGGDKKEREMDISRIGPGGWDGYLNWDEW